MKNIKINKQARLSEHFTLGELCKNKVWRTMNRDC